MMMKRKDVASLLPLLLVAMLFASCGRKYKIEGSSTVTSLDGKMLYLKVLQEDGWQAIDSAEVVHGLFKMSGEADSVMVATLYMGNESILPVVLEPGHVQVTISHSELTAGGTELNNRLYDFIAKRNELEARVADLERKESRLILDGEDADEVNKRLTKEAEDLVKEMSDHLKQFLRDNGENVLAPTVFLMMTSSMPYPMMTPQIEDIMRTASMQMKANPYVREFLDKAKENMRLLEEQQLLQENATLAARKGAN